MLKPVRSSPLVIPEYVHNPIVHSANYRYWVNSAYYRYKGQTAADLVASGLLNPDEIPANRSYRGNGLKVHITKDGLYNVQINADLVLARSRDFKQFLGGLLADTRLSLVSIERYEIEKKGSAYDA
jgi:hypothetical protein